MGRLFGVSAATAVRTDHIIGVYISKSHLDVFWPEDRGAQRFDNSAAGFRVLIKSLNKAPVARIVVEPTGPYHKAFEAALGEVFPLFKVSRPKTKTRVPLENPPNSLSWPSCASSSKWRMLSSKLTAYGSKKALDQDGSFSFSSWRRCAGTINQLQRQICLLGLSSQLPARIALITSSLSSDACASGSCHDDWR